MQHAFYVDGLDTTDGEVLAKVGMEALVFQGFPVSKDGFLDTWTRRSTIEETASDFASARAMGVTSFPALFVRKDTTLARVGSGYAHVDALQQHLKDLGY
ncbi:hypothetical protein [Rhizobium mesoamericanum]|uniref:Uncharacterized protein n=1 Tax=Rhizobium mesoamericanum STM3625 TaxID=1211777 RepID=K0PXD2_9HYPH|nr:hypothetical protein [Rhizobium mesoamericanum]CCM76012.1 conserved hypothetical protein [Rhizobium mesoamericanum STM3625]